MTYEFHTMSLLCKNRLW